MAAFALAVDFTAGAQPQILRFHRHEAAQIAGLQPVLADKLGVEKALVQICLGRQGLPLLHAADIAAAVAEGDVQKLHRKAAHIDIRKQYGFPLAEEGIARGIEALIHMLLPAQHIARAVRAGDQELDAVDHFIGDAAHFELGQHLA